MVGYRRLWPVVAEVDADFWERAGRRGGGPAASMRFLRQPGGSAAAVEELLGAGDVGLALELCPHVAGPFEEERGLDCVAGGGGGGGGADALR